MTLVSRARLEIRRRVTDALWREQGHSVLSPLAGSTAIHRPTPDLVDRKDPGNPHGPLVVSYAGSDPRPAEIGPYSSINDTTYLMLGSNHRLDRITSWVFPELPHAEQIDSNGPIRIGSDVTTGFQSLIMSGVKIDHGAVVAARAVVTKDVEPYQIVGGVPAKPIGWRFDAPTREALLRIAWWEWEAEIVSQHVHQLASSDVAASSRHTTPLATKEAFARTARGSK